MVKICIPSLVVIGLLSACNKEDSKNKVRATAELATVAPAASLHINQELGLASNSPSTSNLTIESLKIPIVSVAIQDGGAVYTCSAGTTAGCLVELVGPSLSNLLTGGSAGEIPEGTYNKAYVQYSSNCGGSGENSDKNIGGTIRASYRLNGVTYYTKAGSVSTTGPAEDMNFAFSRCNNPMALPKPVSVSKDSGPINFKLYIDLQAIAMGTTSLPIVAPGCGASGPNEPGVCVSSPEISITVDQNTPTVERYLLSQTENNRVSGNGCIGIVGLYFTSSGDMFGGQFRSFKDESQNCSTGAIPGSAINEYSKNADGTYNLSDALVGTAAALSSITGFKREVHNGTVSLTTPEGVREIPYAAAPIR
ncbi:MAG: hypothetical protein H7318_20135 [Oligoflexus sp.]|nr:hypothetical protein [Oligoflexus sp.]